VSQSHLCSVNNILLVIFYKHTQSFRNMRNYTIFSWGLLHYNSLPKIRPLPKTQPNPTELSRLISKPNPKPSRHMYKHTIAPQGSPAHARRGSPARVFKFENNSNSESFQNWKLFKIKKNVQILKTSNLKTVQIQKKLNYKSVQIWKMFEFQKKTKHF
jgi:hypothetical protein